MSRSEFRSLSKAPTFTMARGYQPTAIQPSGWALASRWLIKGTLALAALAIGYSALLAVAAGWVNALLGG